MKDSITVTIEVRIGNDPRTYGCRLTEHRGHLSSILFPTDAHVIREAAALLGDKIAAHVAQLQRTTDQGES